MYLFESLQNFAEQSAAYGIRLASIAVDFAVVRPLRYMYFDGPTVLGVGFWEKLPEKDICSRLTGVSATFWTQNEDECNNLVSRKFDTFIVGAFSFAYIWLAYTVISNLMFRFLVLRPIANEIKSELLMFKQQCKESDDNE